jgi:hypothetical protein
MTCPSIRQDGADGGRVKPEPERKDKGRQGVPTTGAGVTAMSRDLAMVIEAAPSGLPRLPVVPPALPSSQFVAARVAFALITGTEFG